MMLEFRGCYGEPCRLTVESHSVLLADVCSLGLVAMFESFRTSSHPESASLRVVVRV